jgi:hypothetical protein
VRTVICVPVKERCGENVICVPVKEWCGENVICVPVKEWCGENVICVPVKEWCGENVFTDQSDQGLIRDFRVRPRQHNVIECHGNTT